MTLSTSDLMRRWRVSHRTLEKWRWAGIGPKCRGGRYNEVDVKKFEDSRKYEIYAEQVMKHLEDGGACQITNVSASGDDVVAVFKLCQ